MTARHQAAGYVAWQMQPEEMHQRQVRPGIDDVVASHVHLMRQSAPEQAHVAFRQRDLMLGHLVVDGAVHDEIHLDLCVPVRRQHDLWPIVEYFQ